MCVFVQANDDVEGALGLCGENLIIYHNPQSTVAPMFGKFYGVEGIAQWLKTCADEFEMKTKPRYFNFSASGPYVYFEAEVTVTVRRTTKTVTLSRMQKFMFDENGLMVAWDIMEDSAQLTAVCLFINKTPLLCTEILCW